eukprot:11958-Heterococcus_DN1.PRE.1
MCSSAVTIQQWQVLSRAAAPVRPRDSAAPRAAAAVTVSWALGLLHQLNLATAYAAAAAAVRLGVALKCSHADHARHCWDRLHSRNDCATVDVVISPSDLLSVCTRARSFGLFWQRLELPRQPDAMEGLAQPCTDALDSLSAAC